MFKFSFLFSLLLLLASAFPAYPEQDESRELDKVSCEITVIYAQKKSPYLHKDLKPLRKYIDESFGGKFDWFDLLESKKVVLKRDEKSQHELPNGDKMALMFAGLTEDKKLFRIHLEIADFHTKVSVKDGALFFQAGRKYKDGIIILAIRVRSEK